MRRVLNILFWVAVVAYYFLAQSFVAEKRRELICTYVEISVVDSIRSRFVSAQDVRQMVVDNRSRKVVGVRMDSVRTADIAKQLQSFAPIRNANIYKTVDGAMHIDIMQRVPVVRIINRYGESFYLDERGDLLRHSSRYCAHVLAANGFINQRPEQKAYNVLTAETPAGKRNIMRELYDLAAYINADRFWKAQIQQIYVRDDGDFELIPTVGAHVIILGTCDKLEAKFAKLDAFYRNGLNVKGWNTYDVINLKYEGQIVATKR